MSKDKISEYSATANSNTDIAGINIDEGCAPSGINNAIRALMKQLKDFQVGTNGDPFNGPVNGTVGATTPAAGAFTTLSASSTLSVTGAGSIQGLTVGRGAGSVSTNTAVGASALAANTSGAQNTALGYLALTSTTIAQNNAGFGAQALRKATTGQENTALGTEALRETTTGNYNSAVGSAALILNTTGANNTGIGYGALFSNTTASDSTAVGYQAAYSSTGGYVTAVGMQALVNNTTGQDNVAVGWHTMYANTTGISSVAVGDNAMRFSTTGGYNVAMGHAALYSNTTASNNTAVGYQAGYSNTTGIRNTFLGEGAGYSNTTSNENTYIGRYSGRVATGAGNTFIGEESGLNATTGTFNSFLGTYSGANMTTGSKNTIIGAYSGNQGGLDIRTASNVVVLSDGDGNPVMQVESSGYTSIGYGTRGSDGGLLLMGSTTSNQGPCTVGFTGAYGARTARWYAGSNSYVKGGTTYDTYTVMAGSTGGVNLTSGATSWASASDERLKDIIEPITDAVTKVSTLRAVIGKYKTDEEGTRRSFLIAQDVQAVLPEAVTEGRNSKEDETDYLNIAYTEVIPLLVAAIQELKAEFDAYKATHP
jgi:hypothetical protein